MPAAQFIRRQSSGLCVVAVDQPEPVLGGARAAHWGIARPWVHAPATHAPEGYQFRLDVGKAANLLGWRCRLSIDTACNGSPLVPLVPRWRGRQERLYGSNRPLFEIRLAASKD